MPVLGRPQAAGRGAGLDVVYLRHDEYQSTEQTDCDQSYDKTQLQ